MKKAIGYILVGLVSFAAGGAAGWLARKKTTEVAFEEITEEEQVKQIAGDDPITRPMDIQKAIDRCFDDIPEGGDTDGDKPRLVELDTQKVQYMKQWKAEEAADKYDTRTKEVPKDVVTTDEDDDLEAGMDQDFLNEVTGERNVRTGADIEEATMEDWDHWLGIRDGDYDCVEVWWFDQDNVLVDGNGGFVLENPGRYMGFDVAQKFEEYGDTGSGDPDIRVIYNHKEGAIFQIIRKHASYDRRTAMEEYGNDGEDDEYERIHARLE